MGKALKVRQLISNKNKAVRRWALCRETVAVLVLASYLVTRAGIICTKTTTLTTLFLYIQPTPKLLVAQTSRMISALQFQWARCRTIRLVAQIQVSSPLRARANNTITRSSPKEISQIKNKFKRFDKISWTWRSKRDLTLKIVTKVSCLNSSSQIKT